MAKLGVVASKVAGKRLSQILLAAARALLEISVVAHHHRRNKEKLEKTPIRVANAQGPNRPQRKRPEAVVVTKEVEVVVAVAEEEGVGVGDVVEAGERGEIDDFYATRTLKQRNVKLIRLSDSSARTAIFSLVKSELSVE